MDRQYLGQRLIERGFEVWFRYMFEVIEGRRFIKEALHSDMFAYFDRVYKGDLTRLCINIPPRAGKTTLMQYFVVFSLTVNPTSNIIYTSYSQSLLSDIANKVAMILEHPVYKAMYPQQITVEDESCNPIDDFWRDYLIERDGKNTYSSKKITTYMGGVCLFSSIGATITGFGAGVRGSKKFSGCLVIDDPQKTADSRSEVLRNKVVRYYEETLLSRLNNPDTPIINIQQRVHIADLSAYLEQKYNFTMLRKPLLDKDGVCQIPSQYTQERIEELQKSAYMFNAQYQQQPIIDGGAVIKRDWFKYYEQSPNLRYKRIIIAADTAMKVKEYNDYSVMGVGGITHNNHLHILDWVRGKWEAPQLERVAVNLWNKWKKDPFTGITCNGFYIEDKASGTGLIQGLKAKYGIPVIGVQVDKDKLSRIEDVLPYIESGNVLLPNGEMYGFNPELLKECESFTRDNSHVHDDQVDVLGMLIKEALAKTEVSLLDFFINDV